ncbi:MAG: tRNA pseudouridine(55) synthase TruB [Chloroflexota bacterium]|nr:tRNA pseudouridine(55) synthase TruB [Chloroflexota bacterium]
MSENKNGILLVNKSINWTSNDVIRKLKSEFMVKKIGHAGTLDPLAKGVLPILINSATKYFDYFLNLNKIYIAEITFGFSTDTFDLEGEIVDKTNKIPSDIAEILEKLNSFKGKINQKPPIYSALKKRGKKLYEYARNNQSVEIEERKVFVQDINVINWDSPKLTLSIECSSGFYVRSFANDLGIHLNSFAVLSNLERVKYGEFSINDYIEIEKKISLEKNIISLDNLFVNNPSLVLNENDEERYYLGNTFQNEIFTKNLLKSESVKIYNKSERFMGLLIYDFEKEFWKPKNIIR